MSHSWQLYSWASNPSLNPEVGFRITCNWVAAKATWRRYPTLSLQAPGIRVAVLGTAEAKTSSRTDDLDLIKHPDEAFGRERIVLRGSDKNERHGQNLTK